MRILGIDPGTTIIGYGIIESDRHNYQAVEYGVCRTPSLVNNSERVVLVFDFFKTLIKKHQPDRAAIEKLFFFKNAKTLMPVSEMRGIIILALSQSGIPIFEFTPLQVKQAVVSYGRAEKLQVQKMTSLILGLKEIPKPDDAADALAVAICAANYNPLPNGWLLSQDE